jgi:hypothetical protein
MHVPAAYKDAGRIQGGSFGCSHMWDNQPVVLQLG